MDGTGFELFLLFFFSCRRRHTRSKRDWSSDVCSSDLALITIELFLIHNFAKFPCFIPNFFLQAEGITKKVREDISIVTPVAIIIYFFSHKFSCVFFLLICIKRILPFITKKRSNMWILKECFLNSVLFFLLFVSRSAITVSG